MNREKLFNKDLTEEDIYQSIRENLITAASMSNAAFRILNEIANSNTSGLTEKAFEAVVDIGKNSSAFIENAEKLVNILNNLDIEVTPLIKEYEI